MKHIKFILPLCLLLAIAAFILPTQAYADTEGYYYYEVSNGEVTIEGCNTTISGNVTLPDTLGGYRVTTIGDWAFYDCDSLQSVNIPDSVTSIGESAFYDCDSLQKVNIPDSVTTIGNSAFSGCDSLQSITIPDSVTSIGNDAFYGCTSLTYNTYDNAKYLGNQNNPYVVLVESVTDDIASCTIHQDAKFIGDWAFSNCSSLQSITIPDSVTSIGNDAFSHCTSLESITIPDSVTSIGEGAFYWCWSLTDVYYSGTETK
ncbi:MAG: leucine-rich repeat domain-containing protein [Oscillospiraceae bacterium]|nr:leucine-rich repeat domain-containing protein [Oscillospiraceae bacterium]